MFDIFYFEKFTFFIFCENLIFLYFSKFWRENFVLEIAWRIWSFDYPNEITKVFRIKFRITCAVIWIFNRIFILKDEKNIFKLLNFNTLYFFVWIKLTFKAVKKYERKLYTKDYNMHMCMYQNRRCKKMIMGWMRESPSLDPNLMSGVSNQ